MIDRKKAFRAWVWNTQKDTGRKRLVIDTNKSGLCIAVPSYDEIAFLEGKSYDTQIYAHFERIPKSKKRLRTRDEVLGFIAWYPHIVVRFLNHKPQPPHRLDYVEPIEMYKWASITEAGEIGEWHKFYITEEEE